MSFSISFYFVLVFLTNSSKIHCIFYVNLISLLITPNTDLMFHFSDPLLKIQDVSTDIFVKSFHDSFTWKHLNETKRQTQTRLYIGYTLHIIVGLQQMVSFINQANYVLVPLAQQEH